MRRFIFAVAAILALALAATTARAADAGVAEAQKIITSQIEAFLNDDMQTAYSYASPGIRQMYPTPSLFFDMVKRGYQPVYRPGNYAFGRSKVVSGGAEIIQEVLIHAPDGKDWTALYTLQRQPDGSLKISSVHMIKSAPPSA